MEIVTSILLVMGLLLLGGAVAFRTRGTSVFAVFNLKLLWIPIVDRRRYLRPPGIAMVSMAWLWLATAVLLRWFLIDWPW